MHKKYTAAMAALSMGQPLFVKTTFFGWNYKLAEKRHNNNNDYGWFICQNKLVVCCHGNPDEFIQIRIDKGYMMLHPLSFLVKKFRHLAKKYNNTIYIDCCYGATKEVLVDGIKIIPLNYSRHVTSNNGWYIDNPEDFNKFYIINMLKYGLM